MKSNCKISGMPEKASAETATPSAQADPQVICLHEAPPIPPAFRPVRLLKIEQDGDAWGAKEKPKIRLMGRWLEKAGFRAGHRVQVISTAPGVLELRFTDSTNH
jgi:hypothetical protein